MYGGVDGLPHEARLSEEKVVVTEAASSGPRSDCEAEFAFLTGCHEDTKGRCLARKMYGNPDAMRTADCKSGMGRRWLDSLGWTACGCIYGKTTATAQSRLNKAEKLGRPRFLGFLSPFLSGLRVVVLLLRARGLQD